MYVGALSRSFRHLFVPPLQLGNQLLMSESKGITTGAKSPEAVAVTSNEATSDDVADSAVTKLPLSIASFKSPVTELYT